MKGKKLNISVGHLKIVDHLILGISLYRIQAQALDHLSLENIPKNSWEQIKQGLQQGELQAGFLPVPLAMELFSAGLDIRFLMFSHRSGSLMVADKHTPLKHLIDLRGKTILIPHGLSVQHMLVHKLLSSVGLELNLPVKANAPGQGKQARAEGVSPVLMPSMLEADEDREIGACMAVEPYGTLAVSQGFARRLCTSDSLWKDHPGCGLVVQADLVSSQGKALEELILHLFQSARLLHTPKNEQLLGWAQEFLDQEPHIVRQALFHNALNFDPEKLVPDREKLDIIQKYMTQTMGLMTQTIDVDAFINPAFALKAVGEIRV